MTTTILEAPEVQPAVNFEFRESDRPILVTLPGNPNWLEILMPMQVV